MDAKIAKWVAIANIGMCLFISAMSWMMMKMGSLLVIGELGQSIAENLELYPWIVSGYIICEIAMIPLSGKLIDHYGEKPVLATGAILFILGAVFGATAFTINDLIFFRCLQGLGAGMVFAVAFSCVGRMFPNHKRNIAHEVMTAAFAVGSLFGTMIGFWFIQKWTWQYSLLFAAMMMAICAFVAVKTLPNYEKVEKFDVPGAVVVSAIFFTVMLYTQCINKKFYLASWQSLVFLVVFLSLIVFLYFIEKRKDNPTFPLRMNATHAKCMLSMFIVSMLGIGMIQYLMKMFLMYYGLNIYEGSCMFFFLLAGGAVTSVVGCRKVTTTGVSRWIILGAILLIIGFSILSQVGDEGIPQIALCMLILGMGFGCMITEILCALQAIVPKKDMGMYSSTIMGLRMVAISVGNVLYATYIREKMDAFIPDEYMGDPIDIINWLIYFSEEIDKVLEIFDKSILACALFASVAFVALVFIGYWIKKDDLRLAEELPDNKL